MNVSEMLSMQARRLPNHEAIVSNGERISYSEWDKVVNQLASSLRSHGVERGDKVILHMPNTKEFLFTYYAVQRLGALVVPINAKLIAAEITYILDHSEAKALITHDMTFSQVEHLDRQHILCIKTGEPVRDWLSLEALIRRGSVEEIECNLNEDDEASLLYTSGTTGDPKGVLFTHRNLLTVATMMAIEMKMDQESRILHMMPLSHSAPLHLFLLAGTYVGATHVLAPMFSPELLLHLVSGEQTTHFFGAPIAYLATGKDPQIATTDLSSMKYWVYGGAPLGSEHVSFVKNQFQTDRLHCVYGLTEAGPNGTLLLPDEHDEKAGSIGKRAALNCEVDIKGAYGEKLPPGEVGELVIRGEGTMKEYYKDELQTKEALRGGWLYTGDMASRDEDGFIWIVDRKKDMIISGGVNIFPKEIESALLTHPSIEDAAVIGIPHPDWGETVKAFLVVSNTLSEKECRTFLADKLASYKIPKQYEVVKELPRNVTGKILKNQLREIAKSKGVKR